MDMFPSFGIRRPLTFGKYPIFHPTQGFSANNLLLGMLYYLLFHDLKGHRFLDTFAKFYFKMWPSLSLYVIKSMFIIKGIIIRLIKTTFFQNFILMAELEGKLPCGRWYLSAHNFPNSGYFHKIFGMHLQEGLVYFYTKKALP